MSTIYDALTTMYEHAKDQMSAEQLQGVAEAMTEGAISSARNMSSVVEGLACLVDTDGAQSGIRAGNFQNADSIFPLLCAISEQFGTIAALVEVGTEATWKAQQIRERDRPGFAESIQ